MITELWQHGSLCCTGLFDTHTVKWLLPLWTACMRFQMKGFTPNNKSWESGGACILRAEWLSARL